MDILEYMSYTHFSKVERLELSILLKKGYSQRDIAKTLGRNPSSVSREIKANSVNGEYDPDKANHKAYVKRWQSKYQGMKIRENEWLEREIQLRLIHYQTPEEIAGRLNTEYGQTIISFKTIYKYLYSGYGQQFCQYLPSKQYKPRSRDGIKKRREIIKNRVFIEDRPDIINDRLRIGDFEGDLLGVPKTCRITLAGIVDRKSLYFQARKIERPRYAIEAYDGLLTEAGAQSFTVDNGVENARYAELNLPTYFCHPYRSWEKGRIENTFQRLRRFIPKKNSLANYSDKDISAIVDIMNNTPRKSLNYKTPKEVFEELKCCN